MSRFAIFADDDRSRINSKQVNDDNKFDKIEDIQFDISFAADAKKCTVYIQYSADSDVPFKQFELK